MNLLAVQSEEISMAETTEGNASRKTRGYNWRDSIERI